MQLSKCFSAVIVLVCAGCATDDLDPREVSDTDIPSSTSGTTVGDDTTSADSGDTGGTSEDSGGESSTSGGGGSTLCTLSPQGAPYAPCEGLCDGACSADMLCMVDDINPDVGVSAAMCVETCTHTREGIVGCSPTNQVPPFHAPTCQNFLCVIPCVNDACPIDYACVQVAGSGNVDVCMPMPLM